MLRKTMIKTLAIIVAMMMVGSFTINGAALAGGGDKKEKDKKEIVIEKAKLDALKRIENVDVRRVNPLLFLLGGKLFDLEDLDLEELDFEEFDRD